jgi:hypothetical protein
MTSIESKLPSHSSGHGTDTDDDDDEPHSDDDVGADGDDLESSLRIATKQLFKGKRSSFAVNGVFAYDDEPGLHVSGIPSPIPLPLIESDAKVIRLLPQFFNGTHSAAE